MREFFAITEAVAKFRHYLFGHRFIICTNQQALKHLRNQTIHTPEQQLWLPKLLGYNFTIEYRPGRENLAADAFSRCFTLACSQPHPLLMEQLQLFQEQDPRCISIVRALHIHSSIADHYT